MSNSSCLYYYWKLQGDVLFLLASGESKSIERMRKRPQHISTIFTYPFHRSKLYTLNLTVKRYLFNPYKSNDNELGNATALIKAKRGACDTTLLKLYTSTHFLLDLFVCLFVCFLSSNYRHYTSYRGLPVIGWNAGDKDGNIFNYARYQFSSLTLPG